LGTLDAGFIKTNMAAGPIAERNQGKNLLFYLSYKGKMIILFLVSKRKFTGTTLKLI
jgi:hypothetical protein